MAAAMTKKGLCAPFDGKTKKTDEMKPDTYITPPIQLPSEKFATLQTLAMAVALFAMCTTVYLKWPPPDLPPAVQNWRNDGREFIYVHTHLEHRIFYRDDEGNGEGVVVCLHGFPTSSYDWLKIWPQLTKQFSRVIALDFLGLGFSDKPVAHHYIKTEPAEIVEVPHNYTIAEQADIVESLLRDLNISSVHILSHDYGDTIAQELVHRFSEKKSKTPSLVRLTILSLCLLNGGIFPEFHHPILLQKLLLIPTLEPIITRLANSWLFGYGLAKTFGPNTKPSASELHDAWSILRFKEGNLVLGKLLNYIPERRQYRDRWVGALQAADIPVHMIYGAQDPVNPPPFDVHYRKLLPKATLDTLPDVGHYIHMEAPERMMDAYVKFLKKAKARL